MSVQQCRCGLLALVMIVMMAGSGASNLRPTREHVSLVQAEASTEQSGKVTRVLKKAKHEMHGANVKGADSGDSSDNEDDDDGDDEDELADAKAARKEAKSELKAFNNEAAFEEKINAEVTVMANETQSETLASFLGELRMEMRTYAEPTYPAYLEKKVEEKEKKIKELEAELKEPPKKAVPVKVEPAKAEKEEKEPKEKDKEESKEKSKDSDDAEDLAQKAGKVWALSFFANVILLATVFAMASAQNDKVRGSTWFLIDQVIAIFLAVMYFQAFNSFMDFGSFGTHNEIVAGICHAVLMLAIVLFAAYKFRNDGVTLAILCGAGAHIVSFSSIDAAADTQNKVWVSYNYGSSMMLFGLAVLGLGLFVIGYLVYTAKKRGGVLDADDFMDKTDDLENDFGSMAFSVVFTMFVRYLLTGHHPVDDDTDFDHTKQQRMNMLIYACVALIAAAFLTPFFAKKAAEAAEANSYAKKRIWTFLTTVVTMNVAWAWLYWGEWEFFEALFPDEPNLGRILFAISMSAVGALGIAAITKLEARKSAGKITKSADKVALTALSLLIAWSWELCFDAAVEDMVEGAAHPVAWKVSATLALFACVLPVYAMYVKPAVKLNGGDA